MGRVHSATDDTILGTPDYKTYAFLQIGGGAMTFDCFISGSIETNVGNPVQTATFNLHLGKGASSISPLLSTSQRNLNGNGPAVDIGAEVNLLTACVAPGEDPLPSMRYVFRGYIDDYSMGSGEDVLTIKCRDIYGQTLADRWIDTDSVTDQGHQYGFPVGAQRVDDAMRVILALAMGSGPIIDVQGTPDLALSAYWQEQMTVMDALRRVGCMTTGWDLRGRWDRSGLDQFDLAYYNPDRSKIISYVTLIGNESSSIPHYTSLKLASSIANVRTVCDVIASGNDLRVPQRRESAIGIVHYGRRFAGLSEDISSHIDTDPEAAELAQIMVDDLSVPPIDVQLEMPYYWLLEVNDLFRIEPDGFMYDADNIYAVSSIVHTFAEDGSATTTLGGSLAPRTATREWFQGRKRMNQVRLGEPAGPGLEGDIWCQVDNLDPPTVI